MIKLKSLLNEVLKEGVLRGEWWIQDGQAVFADGDVGDMNHEAFVIQRLKYDILDSLGVDLNRVDDNNLPEITDFADEIFDNIKDELTPEELEAWQNEEIPTVIASYLQRSGDLDIQNKLYYLRGHDDRGRTLDVRQYALTHWGWQRVKGNVVQTQTLTSNDLSNIVSGLYDAYNDDLEDEPEHTFNIEVMATRSWYEGVPLSVLEKKNPTALNAYRSRY